MHNSTRNFLIGEIWKLTLGLLTSLGMLLLLSLLRHFSTGTFLFIQIILVSILMLVILYSLSMYDKGKKWIRGSEIYLTIFAFTISSFLLLNIDRSRSVYLLNWVDSAGDMGISAKKLESIGEKHDLSGNSLEQRIEEQIQSGNLHKGPNGLLRSTKRGHMLNNLFEIIARIENLEGYQNAGY